MFFYFRLNILAIEFKILQQSSRKLLPISAIYFQVSKLNSILILDKKKIRFRLIQSERIYRRDIFSASCKTLSIDNSTSDK